MKVGLILFLLPCLLPSSSWAWWDHGHETIGALALKGLTPVTQAKVNKLLQFPLSAPGSAELSKKMNTLSSASSWADHIGDQLFKSTLGADRYGSTCHYLDLVLYSDELGVVGKNPESLRSKILEKSKSFSDVGGKNYLSCTRDFIKVLTSPQESDENKAVALRYLIHVLGDLHQPLHSFSVSSREPGSTPNRGGNLLKIPPTQISVYSVPKPLFQQVTNLHFLWDAGLGAFKQLKKVYFKDPEDLAGLKNAERSAENSPAVQEAVKDLLGDKHRVAQIKKKFLDPKKAQSLENWVIESIDLGVNGAYQGLSKTSKDYIKTEFSNYSEYHNRNVVKAKSQMLLAGLRLSQVLNAIYDPKNASRAFVTMIYSASNPARELPHPQSAPESVK